MNTKIIFIAVVTIALLVGLSILGKSKNANKQALGNQPQNSTGIPQTRSQVSDLPADKIEVVHFHATQQCWSCITVGEYAKKTIEKSFPQEYAEGKIVFSDINGELAQNHQIVAKYGAGGSSLFINAVRDGKDNISEDVTVWRLVGNEKQFTDYFEDKLKRLLGN